MRAVRSSLRFGDVLGLSLTGLRRHPGRTMLTVLGIAFGVAAIVAVLGITASGRAALIARLDQLGTNLIRVTPGSGVFGNADGLPPESAGMLGRVGPVEGGDVHRLAGCDGAAQRPAAASGNRRVVGHGRPRRPARSAERPDVRRPVPGRRGRGCSHRGVGEGGRPAVGDRGCGPGAEGCTSAGEWFEVIGVLGEMTLHPDIERSVLIGEPAARDLFIEDLRPTALYVRVHPDRVTDVLEVIPATVDPENPGRVAVTRPVDALVARRQAEGGLHRPAGESGERGSARRGGGDRQRDGDVGDGAAYGDRSAPGHGGPPNATYAASSSGRRCCWPGPAGCWALWSGAAITAAFVVSRDLTLVVPLSGLAGSILVALVVGALAGIYPAVRAARIPPAEAVRSA